MTKDENLNDPNSCLNRAQGDEPIFVLRANDEIAPIVIRHWASLYLYMKTSSGADINLFTDKQKEKYLNALMDANSFEEWRKQKDEFEKWTRSHRGTLETHQRD
jgi:hypothetical protein